MAVRNLITGSILILFFINVADAAADEKYSTYRYDCKARFNLFPEVILVMAIPDDEDTTEAEIALHGEIIKTYFERDGLEKIWFLQSDENLMIVLDAQLIATYHDSRSDMSSTPSQFECWKVKNR